MVIPKGTLTSFCSLVIVFGVILSVNTTYAAPRERKDSRALYFIPSSSPPTHDGSPLSPYLSKFSPSHSSSASSSTTVLDSFSSSLKSIKSKLTCGVCKTAVGLVQFLVSVNSTQDTIVKAAVGICVKFGIEKKEVCAGIVPEFAPEILTVLKDLVLSPAEICGVVLGPTCGDPYNPLDNWNVTFPKVPQPKPAPPTPPKPGSPTVRILHLSDTHFDALYKEGNNANCGEPLCCRQSNGVPANKSDRAWKFGDYRGCDTPLWTLENMMQHLSAQKDKIDMIYWTGDLPAHDVWNQTQATQLNSLRHMVSLMLHYFPGKPIFPSLGNHESAPVNSFPPPYVTGKYSISWLYDALADSWKNWLPQDAIESVRKGAYYTVSPQRGFRIISLNMNYCNSENWWMLLNTTDPAGELSWLINTLQAAETSGEKVHILGHIPPGDQGCLKAWSWNYYKVVNRYQNTISGQFFGHVHYDLFQVFYDLETLTRPVSVAYVTPSVTPFSGLNVGYRFFTVDGVYDGSSYQVLDHETYILNLTRANLEDKITWEFEYSAKDKYNMANLYASDWDKLINVMANNQTVLETYNRLYFKSARPAVCDSACRLARLCEVKSARSHDPDICRDLGVKSHRHLIDLGQAGGRQKQC